MEIKSYIDNLGIRKNKQLKISLVKKYINPTYIVPFAIKNQMLKVFISTFIKLKIIFHPFNYIHCKSLQKAKKIFKKKQTNLLKSSEKTKANH